MCLCVIIVYAPVAIVCLVSVRHLRQNFLPPKLVCRRENIGGILIFAYLCNYSLILYK